MGTPCQVNIVYMKKALHINHSLIIITPEDNGYNPGCIMFYTVEIKKGK